MQNKAKTVAALVTCGTAIKVTDNFSGSQQDTKKFAQLSSALNEGSAYNDPCAFSSYSFECLNSKVEKTFTAINEEVEQLRSDSLTNAESL